MFDYFLKIKYLEFASVDYRCEVSKPLNGYLQNRRCKNYLFAIKQEGSRIRCNTHSINYTITINSFELPATSNQGGIFCCNCFFRKIKNAKESDYIVVFYVKCLCRKCTYVQL